MAPVRKKESYFGAQYRRIAPRRGKKKAIIAVAHSLAIAIYHILKSKNTYRELGADFFDKIHPLKVLFRLTKRIESLGYSVQVAPIPDRCIIFESEEGFGEPWFPKSSDQIKSLILSVDAVGRIWAWAMHVGWRCPGAGNCVR